MTRLGGGDPCLVSIQFDSISLILGDGGWEGCGNQRINRSAADISYQFVADIACGGYTRQSDG